MSTNILKSPKTFSEQAKILQEHGVIVHDITACENFLSKVNYYRFSGYLLPFYRNDSSVTFETVKSVYEFDQEIRNLTFKSIEKIEIYVRTQIAYTFSHKYGAEGYMNRDNFNDKFQFGNFQKRFKNCIYENRKSPVIRHHKEKYNGHFPLWTIVDYFTLGMLSYFYSGMKNNDKDHLAFDLYGVNYYTLSGWLKSLTDLRNRCAHYARLYYWAFPSVPAIKRKDKIGHLDHTLFSQFYMLKYLYPTPESWNRDFFLPLYTLMDNYRNAIELKHIGFPENWTELLRQRY